MQQLATDNVRISKDLLDKIRFISKNRGQTIAGYINTNLSKQIDKDWIKFKKIDNEKKSSI